MPTRIRIDLAGYHHIINRDDEDKWLMQTMHSTLIKEI